MRSFLLVLLVACSATRPPAEQGSAAAPHTEPPTPPAPSPASGPEPALEDLLSTSANGLARMPPDFFPILGYTDQVADRTERCWTELKSQLVAGYHVMLPSSTAPSQRDAYFIVEGKLPREQVEQCVPRAFKNVGLEIQPAGDLVAFKSSMGTVYAAWRGRFVVLGGERQVTEALRTPTHEASARWHALMPPVPNTILIWILSIDQRPTNFTSVLGAPPTDVMFTFDKLQPKPHAMMMGRFIAHYATPAMATKSAAWIKSWSARGKLPLSIPPPANMVDLYNRIAKAIAGTKLTQDGNRVQIDWDSDMFGGLGNMSSLQQAGDQLLSTP